MRKSEHIVIRPKGFNMIFSCLGGVVALGFFISAIPLLFVYCGVRFWTVLFSIVSGYLACYFVFFLVSLFDKKILIDNSGILVFKDKFGKLLKVIQYFTFVQFDEIKDFNLLRRCKNSENEDVIGLTSDILYLVIECKDGGKKMYSLNYYSSKQINRISDLIDAGIRSCRRSTNNGTEAR